MNKVKLSLLTAIFIATALTFFACDKGGKSALVGRWDLVEVPVEGNPKDIELLSDGTGIVDKAGITYKTENGRFYVTRQSGEAESYSYKVSGSTLTLTKDDGTILEYLKKGNIVNKKEKPGNFTDSRDGKTYKTIKMPGGKVWFAENLNYAAEDSKCYGNKEENCKKYGRLYDWGEAMKACPKDWHLPSYKEWKILGISIGDSSTAGVKLKAASGWNDNGTDDFGFAAIPGGYGVVIVGDFRGVGSNGYWWSSAGDGAFAYFWDEDAHLSRQASYVSYSVRCVQD
jgi:uncharacterized protein (TIGR02145 family)